MITPPKTPKSNCTIAIPEFLLTDHYLNSMYCVEPEGRLFPCTKHFFEKEMQRGVKFSGVKHICLHNTRHSHCALLFEMGIPPLEVAERLGHEKVQTTMDTYSHLYPSKQAEVATKLDILMGTVADSQNVDIL